MIRPPLSAFERGSVYTRFKKRDPNPDTMSGQGLSVEKIVKGIRNPSRVVDEVILDYVYRTPAIVLNSFSTIGTNVFDREWDALIVLDTARVDALREVADEYDFITDVDSIWSTGGASAEWLARTFDEAHAEEIRETAFLSAQSHIQEVLDTKVHETDSSRPLPFKTLRLMPSVDIDELDKAEYLFKFETVGEEGPFGHTEANTPPRYATDRGIAVGRQRDPDRLMIQYHQPHTPWFSQALAEDRELKYHEYDWWNYYYDTGDTDRIWEAYMSDLRYVLDEIEILLNNLDAERVVITADHGEAFGEYGVLGHKLGSVHPKVRKVPWIETSAVDHETHEPTVEEPDRSKMSREELDHKLEALGYKV
ncbi:alkaline phosphatase family protein [Haloplanus rubicundus]|uniref:hypothetical protein n=1 Tax=Haloplanus rubicundus TaxID=1547898 RepID=UPI0021CB3105|nr:hypothetical protein [Haloplanus rubicundus]